MSVRGLFTSIAITANELSFIESKMVFVQEKNCVHFQGDDVISLSLLGKTGHTKRGESESTKSVGCCTEGIIVTGH